MPKKKHSVEQTIHKLRQADVLLSQGRTVAEVRRGAGLGAGVGGRGGGAQFQIA